MQREDVLLKRRLSDFSTPLIPKGLRHAAQGCESHELPWVGFPITFIYPAKGCIGLPHLQLQPMPQSLAKTLVHGIYWSSCKPFRLESFIGPTPRVARRTRNPGLG